MIITVYVFSVSMLTTIEQKIKTKIEYSVLL